MTRQLTLRHEFVEFIPEQLHDSVLYVSIPYTTAAHLCACGCGKEVITPISPTDWKVTFDGETISLWPSIGNWSFPCQSHYWIEGGRIRWAPKWTKEQIERGRAQSRLAKERWAMEASSAHDLESGHKAPLREGFIRQLLRKIRSKDPGPPAARGDE